MFSLEQATIKTSYFPSSSELWEVESVKSKGIVFLTEFIYGKPIQCIIKDDFDTSNYQPGGFRFKITKYTTLDWQTEELRE